MGWTKLELVDAALEELGLAQYNFDVQPELKESARRRMDTMVAEWMARGLQLSYSLDSDINSDSGLSLTNSGAVYLALALRIAPGLGKTASAETKTAYAAAMDSLWIRAAQPNERQPTNDLPRGEGQKPWRTIYNPFVSSPDVAPLRAPLDDVLDVAKD
jgi:hypothetical protein